MNPAEALALLRRLDQKITRFSRIGAVLGWDQETYLPEGAVEGRGEQLAALEGLIHEWTVDPAFREALETLQGTVLPEESAAALAGEWRRRVERACKLPQEYVERRARHISLSQHAWAAARKAKDFGAFRPYLETMVGLTREATDYLGPAAHPYDLLIEEYEPGTTTAELKSLFAGLAPELSALVKAIAGRPPLDDSPVRRHYPRAAQEAFGREVLGAMGFDFNRGRLDVTTHPFCTTLGFDDVRLTTRYNEGFFNEAVYGMIHEMGHGLYEQGFDPSLRDTALADGTSLGLHESQSRFWENTVGRSRAWITWAWPRLQAHFPEATAGLNPEAFYRAVNKVEPSFIRVEADEVTYNLHIILRFELECALITGDLAVADLPGAWNERFTQLFGLTPPDDAQGCLQDVHWSMGGLGYFPTYSLGNLYAAQWRTQLQSELDLNGQISRGDFAPILAWLRSRLHRWGRTKTAGQLVQEVTGGPLNPQAFLGYLKTKYGELYGL